MRSLALVFALALTVPSFAQPTADPKLRVAMQKAQVLQQLDRVLQQKLQADEQIQRMLSAPNSPVTSEDVAAEELVVQGRMLEMEQKAIERQQAAVKASAARLELRKTALANGAAPVVRASPSR